MSVARVGRPGLVVASLALAAVTLTGCIRPGGPEGLRRQLVRGTDVQLDREFGITMTRTALMLARWGVKIAGKSDEIPLKGIRRVEVGVYEVVDGESMPSEPRLPEFSTAVRVREQDERVFLMIREREDGRIREALVVVVEADEWVLVRIKGKLDKVMDQAIRMAMSEADHDDLAERTVTAYHDAISEPG